MSKNSHSLVFQVRESLRGRLAIGESKHDAKASGEYKKRIYSWQTFYTYQDICVQFVRYCKALDPSCRRLADCRKYAGVWLQETDAGCSAWTQKLRRAALAKLYGCRSTEFPPAEPRKREDIKRSRGKAARDAHFSEKNNADIVQFARQTGLRRSELAALTGRDLKLDEIGRVCVYVRRGKGGRQRLAPVIGNVEHVKHLMDEAGDGKIFDSVPSGMDVHSYRREYAQAMYNALERDLSGLQRSEKYYCRGDKKGRIYDREALKATSAALGHGGHDRKGRDRLGVIVSHYLE